MTYPSYPSAAIRSGAARISVAELEPGDFVLVGGWLRRVRRVTGGSDVTTSDGRYYGIDQIRRCVRRSDVDVERFDVTSDWAPKVPGATSG